MPVRSTGVNRNGGAYFRLMRRFYAHIIGG